MENEKNSKGGTSSGKLDGVSCGTAPRFAPMIYEIERTLEKAVTKEAAR